ncbi:MAG: lytic transglycosylase domain-containing protein [Acidimicrobiia bacterium]
MSIPALGRMNAIQARLDSMRPRSVGGAASNAVPLGGVPSTSVENSVAAAYTARAGAATPTTAITFATALANSLASTATTPSTASTATLPTAGEYGDVEAPTRNGNEKVSSATPFADLFNEAGAKHGISPRLLAAVSTVESNFNTKAVSPAGAQGLMQFMPSTAAGMGVDPWDPASAIDGAARLLVGHRDRFGSIASALAAYNEGGGTVARYGGKVPPQTQGYVNKILTIYRGGSS